MDDVRPGVLVRLPDRHQRGRVLELDRSLMVARVLLNDGHEVWERLEELEQVEERYTHRRVVA